jgi:hypothetical protein
MGDPVKGKLAGHALVTGWASTRVYPYKQGGSVEAVCECGARSPRLATVEARRQWHREHKADVLDTWVSNGVDDRGNEVHL